MAFSVVKLMRIFCKCNKFIAGQEGTEHINDTILEESIDAALLKADYDWDGYITWDEYIYSMGDQEAHQKATYETHEVDHNETMKAH